MQLIRIDFVSCKEKDQTITVSFGVVSEGQLVLDCLSYCGRSHRMYGSIYVLLIA